MPTLLVLKEREPGETRAAATPETVRRLRKLGLTVLVERAAGEGSLIADHTFTAAGAQVVPDDPGALAEADLVLGVNPPSPVTLEALHEQALVISFLWPHQQRRTARALIARRLSAFAMEAIPRISRAQGMDALSSQSNLAGYKAALLAASALPRLMPMMMTAAGTMTPARVVVLGAGVAGLQAVATARRLGAVVEVSDVRLAVREQVQSLGARFLAVEGAEDLEGAGGYAQQASAEFLARQQELVAKHIGGADMPVVISSLNSYSGLAAAMTGFVLQNNLLVIGGSLVGAAGLILTQIMCRAMNRSLASVLFGGFGAEPAATAGQQQGYSRVKSVTPEEVALILDGAGSVVFVPGYGLAVAQAQHAVRELAERLQQRGAQVRYAIHPVAGRMPGHMNVLLAEANVPYEQLLEMDQINPELKATDVVLVLGANDVVNPAAQRDPQSPIYGMPIINAHEARTVLLVKRSLSPGFAGIPNPLFEAENSLMVFGDAKKVLIETSEALDAL